MTALEPQWSGQLQRSLSQGRSGRTFRSWKLGYPILPPILLGIRLEETNVNNGCVRGITATGVRRLFYTIRRKSNSTYLYRSNYTG